MRLAAEEGFAPSEALEEVAAATKDAHEVGADALPELLMQLVLVRQPASASQGTCWAHEAGARATIEACERGRDAA